MGGDAGVFSTGPSLVFILIYLAVLFFFIIAMWKFYAKADYPGVAAIIPIYNVYVLFKMAKYSGWMIFLLLIPIVNFVIIILVYMRIATGFGKGTGFGLGLIFLSPIFIPILAFGSADYDESRIEA